MNTLGMQIGLARGTSRRDAPWTLGPLALRVLLVAACVASVVATSQIGGSSAAPMKDAELALLLRGMAALKGLMVVAAAAILLWRFGLPIAPRIAMLYVASTGLMAAAATSIWQLHALLPAATAFHAGLVVALIVAWRGDDLPTRPKRFA